MEGELEQVYFQFNGLPPSVNSLYKSLRPTYDGLSKLRKFQIDLLEHLDPYLDDVTKKINGPVSVEITLYMSGKQKRDIDNYIKPLIDQLKNILFQDDYMIKRLLVEKFEDCDKDLTTVIVKKL